MNRKIKRRMKNFMLLFLILLLFLLVRLAQIQMFETESFSRHHVNLIKKSVEQRTQAWTINEGRGRFIDRNKEALTHDYYPTLVIFPFVKNMEWPYKTVSQIIKTDPSTLYDAVLNAKEPFMYGGKNEPFKLTEAQMNQINKMRIPGVFALKTQVELSNQTAVHLLGILRENEELVKQKYADKLEKNLIHPNIKIGITGLQRAFDEFLLPEGETKLLYHVDNIGSPMFGLDVKYQSSANPYYPISIQTTINKDFQQFAEETIDDLGLKKGGLVLLDAKNSDVLAMVSRPKIDEKHPFEKNSAQNQMIVPHVPGSIFKIVTAAAVLDNHMDVRGRTFNCDKDLYGEGNSQKKLGELNFEESFAMSCNYTFAKLAEEMMEKDRKVLNIYSEKLGLLNNVGWQGTVFHYANFMQFPEEKSGKVWNNDSDLTVARAINQTAIGQKDVRISPLAVANMLATIARGGEKMQVRAVSDILYKNGSSLYSFPEKKLDDNRISSYSATMLQEMLRKVVTDGTGRQFRDLPYKVAGKSGTAETGKDAKINKWFAGYFPADKPKYVLVTVDLDEKGTEVRTNKIFSEMVKQLYEYDRENE